VASPRIRRKDLRRPDEFVELSGQAWQWLTHHRVTVYAVAGAVVLALVGARGIRAYQEHRAETAADALQAALATYSGGNATEAMAAFADVPAVGSYGTLANLYRGRAAVVAGDLAAAVESFRRAAADGAAPAYLRQQAVFGLADALARSDDREGAIAQYEAAAALAGPLAIDARMSAARLYEVTGATDKARALYEATLKDAADAPGPYQDDARAVAEWHLARLSVPATP
jgi:hypothetical protein